VELAAASVPAAERVSAALIGETVETGAVVPSVASESVIPNLPVSVEAGVAEAVEFTGAAREGADTA
jgi:hypothetical protein